MSPRSGRLPPLILTNSPFPCSEQGLGKQSDMRQQVRYLLLLGGRLIELFSSSSARGICPSRDTPYLNDGGYCILYKVKVALYQV